MSRLSFALVALFCSLTFAEPPLATVAGPHEAKQGELVVLDASQSVGEFFAWKVTAEVDYVSTASRQDDLGGLVSELRAAGYNVAEPAVNEVELYVEIDDGRRLVLSTYPGVYHVALAVGNDEGVALTVFDVRVSSICPVPTPPVVVTPPTPPLPTSMGLIDPVATAVAAQVTATNRAEYADIASTYEVLGRRAANGEIKTPAELVEATRAATAAVPGWSKIVSETLGPALSRLASSGQLVTMAQHATAWSEISEGVRRAINSVPNPPPVPPPSTAPFPADKLSVMILEETSERRNLPLSQLILLQSTTFRTELAAIGAEWRIWDDDVDARNESSKWQAALSAWPGEKLPWLLVSNGRSGFSGSLPLTEEETLSIIRRFK